jgi:hypothetical protein
LYFKPSHHHQNELSTVEQDIAHFCTGFETFIKAVKTGSKLRGFSFCLPILAVTHFSLRFPLRHHHKITYFVSRGFVQPGTTGFFSNVRSSFSFSSMSA